uniref:Uncharacterized protein n=1 Tax=Rhizophora mucronata TaxID=61149 RepID=A0A2P2JUR0_RHIMU
MLWGHVEAVEVVPLTIYFPDTEPMIMQVTNESILQIRVSMCRLSEWTVESDNLQIPYF